MSGAVVPVLQKKGKVSERIQSRGQGIPDSFFNFVFLSLYLLSEAASRHQRPSLTSGQHQDELCVWLF